MLDTALGSGVNEPLMDVGELWTIDGAAGGAICVAATATPGSARIAPNAKTKVVEIRLTRARSQYVAVTSLSRICPRVPTRYVQIGLHVDSTYCKNAFAVSQGVADEVNILSLVVPTVEQDESEVSYRTRMVTYQLPWLPVQSIASPQVVRWAVSRTVPAPCAT